MNEPQFKETQEDVGPLHVTPTRDARLTWWMSRSWWVALGLATILIVMTQGGQVGAPAQAASRVGLSKASTSEPGKKLATIASELPRIREEIRLAERLRTISVELDMARAALEIERERTRVLEASYEGLDKQFDTVTQMLRDGSPAQSGELLPAVPMPIEAVFVRETNH